MKPWFARQVTVIFCLAAATAALVQLDARCPAGPLPLGMRPAVNRMASGCHPMALMDGIPRVPAPSVMETDMVRWQARLSRPDNQGLDYEGTVLDGTATSVV